MSNNWLKFYTEFNTDTQEDEYIAVGEKNNQPFKSAFKSPERGFKSRSDVINWVNKCIENYHSI